MENFEDMEVSCCGHFIIPKASKADVTPKPEKHLEDDLENTAGGKNYPASTSFNEVELADKSSLGNSATLSPFAAMVR